MSEEGQHQSTKTWEQAQLEIEPKDSADEIENASKELTSRSGLTLNDLLTEWGVYAALSDMFRNAMQNLVDQLGGKEQIILQLESWREALRPAVEYVTAINEFIEQYPQLEEEALDVLRRYHWIPFSTMPNDFLYQLLQLSYKQGNRTKAINQLYIDHFLSDDGKELVEMVESWKDNAIFKPRMKIFRDCVAAVTFAGCRYNAANIVVPTLVAQIDGVLTELGKYKGIHAPPHKRGKEFAVWLPNVTQDEYFSGRINDFILKVLFHSTTSEEKGITIPYRYNRHKVMHGQHLRYGNVPDMLRTFLVLDYLAQIPL